MKTSKHEDSKVKKKLSVPVVEVERISELKPVKKEKNVTSTAGNYITNGAVKTESRVPLEEPIIEELDIKPPVSPHPALSAPCSPSPAHTSPATLSPALASEVDTAVSSILVSEVETELETSNIAMATPLVSMTTTTVTTASITKAATTVTNVTDTTSATSVFSCTGKQLRLGGSHFTLGNISYSDSGVLRTLNAGADNSYSKNKNNNSPFLLKTSATSTVSSPVKNAISSSNALSGTIPSMASFQSVGTLQSSKSFTSVKSSCSISGNLVINAVISSSNVKPNLNVPPVISSPTVVNIVTNTSPGFKPNVIKSISASGKLSGGASGKSANPHRTGTGLKSGLSSEELMKKYPAVEKPDKIIPLKGKILNNRYSKCSNILNTFLLLFANEMLVSGLEVTKCLSE